MAAKDMKLQAIAPSPSVFACSETVVVQVGSEKKRYMLHTDLLKFHSGYFRGALSGAFKESVDGSISLTDVDTDAFDIFVNYIYNGILSASVHTAVEVGQKLDGPVALRWKVYVLADRLIIPELKRDILNLAFNYFSEKSTSPAVRLIIYFFENLPHDDTLLQLATDAHCINNGVASWNGHTPAHIEFVPKEFLIQVMQKMEKLLSLGSDQRWLKREDYGINAVAKKEGRGDTGSGARISFDPSQVKW
ncbi:hypothetical protein NX059_008943 [Plenodomus lindquistii]|nr:hypothetical protein NX059_008943 [Plenodomus lindquistii]